MILIADSGSTKTSWYFSKGENHSEYISTSGINPFFRTTEDIIEELEKDLIPKIDSSNLDIYFYGAGIINDKKGEVVKLALKQLFPSAKIEVKSDLLAAARATLGDKKGIACILGTGSNSCLYDGREIVEHISPLGFILGDEGSGAVLGRKLLGDYLKGIMPENLTVKFKNKFQISYSDFLDSVYKKERPNKFLAQLTPFLYENIDDVYCSKLVENAFDSFVGRNVKQYTDFAGLEINFIGSVAYYFKQQLQIVLNENKLKLGRIVKEPLQGLAEFHQKNIA